MLAMLRPPQPPVRAAACVQQQPLNAPTPAAERVGEFLTSKGEGGEAARLAVNLAPNNVAGWLARVSRCGLDGAARICTDYCVSHRLPLLADVLAGLRPAHAEALVAALLSQLCKVDSELQAAATPHGMCYSCNYRTFRKPNGKLPRYCLNCGADL